MVAHLHLLLLQVASPLLLSVLSYTKAHLLHQEGSRLILLLHQLVARRQAEEAFAVHLSLVEEV